MKYLLPVLFVLAACAPQPAKERQLCVKNGGVNTIYPEISGDHYRHIVRCNDGTVHLGAK